MPTTQIELTPTLPYDFHALHTFFSARLISGVEAAGEGHYARTFAHGRAKGRLLVTPAKSALRV